MKKALVYYLYGNRNAGDMAICLGTIEFLKKHGYEISMVSRFSESENEYWRSREYLLKYYPDVKIYPGPFSFERNFSAVKKMFSYARSMLKVTGIIPDKQTKQLVGKADDVFFNGGNLLRGASLTDYMRLSALFYPIRIAHAMCKPVYCLPQSTAKISKYGEKILNSCLYCFNKVFVREKISFDELSKKFPDILFLRSTDMAFFCGDTETASSEYEALGLEQNPDTVAVVVRNTGIGDIGELSSEKQELLKKKLLAFIREHSDFNYLIVVQTEKDRAFSDKIYNEVAKLAQVRIVENHDPLVLREIYKRTRFLITMRLHAAILSLSARTPVVGLFSEEWGLKNPGIMRDYNMPYIIIENSGDVPPAMPTDIQKASIVSSICKYTEILNSCLLKKIDISEKL